MTFKEFIIKYTAHTLYLMLLSSVSLTYWFNYQLLLHLGWGVALLIGFYIFLAISLGTKLNQHTNPAIKKVGKFYEMVFAYTSLFQGTVLLNLTFYLIGSINDGVIYSMHMFDWIYGIMYCGFIVYGIGCIMMVSIAETFSGKVIAFLIPLIHWACFLYTFLYESDFKIIFENHTNMIILISFFIQLMSSILMFTIIIGTPIQKTKKKNV